jgi:hypothetical protein
MSHLQMAQAMQEREQHTWDVLDRLYESGAKLEDLKELARESGCYGWRPKQTKGERHAAHG